MERIGLDGKLYRNTGTYASPTWTEIDNVKDVSFSCDADKADVTTRRSDGWKEYLMTLFDAGIEFEMVWDTEDANFTAIQDAFFSRGNLDIAVMDGDIAVDGAEGLRATVGVAKFGRKEPLAEAMTVDVSLVPVKNDNSPPEWVVVSGGSLGS